LSHCFADADGFMPVLGCDKCPKDTEHMKPLLWWQKLDQTMILHLLAAARKELTSCLMSPLLLQQKTHLRPSNLKLVLMQMMKILFAGSKSSSDSSDETSTIQELTNAEVNSTLLDTTN
jgi:hypothetical protein